jgi:hypothetical protein
MFGLETLDGGAQAVAIMGIVLIEAIVLYIGYGALEQLLGPTITKLLRGE